MFQSMIQLKILKKLELLKKTEEVCLQKRRIIRLIDYLMSEELL